MENSTQLSTSEDKFWPEKWWYDQMWSYDLVALTDEIINIKKARKDLKTLSEESYDFVIHLSQVI